MTRYGILVNMNEVYKKLDEKIKELNSTRVFKKVTPKGDLSWYVKWTASFFILTAVAARSVGTIPLIDLWFSLVGTLGWLWVGMLWHDRALTMLNGALATVLLMGLMNFYFG
tara:strand:- start:124 stop:459 length:336 start_codon:yes stop_codon:yes gene_type:complete